MKLHLNSSADVMENLTAWGKNQERGLYMGDRRNANRKPSLLFAIPAWAGH